MPPPLEKISFFRAAGAYFFGGAVNSFTNGRTAGKERRKNNLPFYGGLLPSDCPFFSLNNPLFASKNSQSETKIPALKLVTYFFDVPKGIITAGFYLQDKAKNTDDAAHRRVFLTQYWWAKRQGKMGR